MCRSRNEVRWLKVVRAGHACLCRAYNLLGLASGFRKVLG